VEKGGKTVVSGQRHVSGQWSEKNILRPQPASPAVLR
jgi:hypothetical protein